MSGREIVAAALELLRANYVFPEVAERAATAVETRLAAGEYDDLDEPALAELLTSHLNEICDDKHLRVRARGPRPGGPGGGPGPGPGSRPGGPGRRRAGPVRGREEPEDHEARVLAMRRMGRLDNFGIHRVERLDGNIGYLDLRRVPVPAIAGRPWPPRWSSSPGPTRSSSTCAPTGAARRTGSCSGAATCSTSSRPTSTTSSGPTPARPGSSGRCPTSPARATSTARSTC